MLINRTKAAPVRLFSTALLVTAPGAALAQQSAPSGLEEVVVTAQKRVQSLQDAPIAISAYGAQELEQRGIKDITDLGTTAPNVKITPLPSNTAKATIAIRGSVTSNPAITWEPTVGMYLDGVFIGKFSGNTFKVAELERIEVLRGPQGTLYGKNTIGGAVNMITKRPTGELGGKLRAGVGNHGYWEIYGTLDLPALEMGALGNLKSKITLSQEERDGFYDNVAATQGGIMSGAFQPNTPSNSEFNSLDSQIGRLDLLWDVTNRLSARYTGDWIDTDNTPAKPQFTALNPTDPTLGMPLPADLGKYLLPDDKNVDETTSDAPMEEGFKSDSHSLFVDYDIGTVGALGDLSVKYIGNTRNLEFKQALDNDGTPFEIFHTSLETEYEQMSHELQINGATERTDYVLGLYYFEEEADVFNPLEPMNEFFGPFVLNNRYGFEGEQIAAYGQIEWRPPVLDDRLALTGGLRWTQEEKDAFIEHPVPNFPAFSAQADDKWTNVTPTIIAAYDITRDINVYAKYSEGFKAGGFNGESGAADAFRDGYDPEEVKAYEIGLKSRLLDNTLQLNMAAFLHDESDLQLSVFSSGSSASSTVENAGDSTKQGVEAEVIYQPTNDLQLTANAGYLDAEYDEFQEFDPNVGRIVDKSDQKANQYAPQWTANASVEYTFARGQWGEATARLDYSYNDEFVAYVEPGQNAQLGGEFDAYGLFNGRVSVSNIPVGSQSTLNIALWGKNLTDEEYRLNGIPFGPFAVSYFGNPRTYGLEATLNF